MQQQVPATARPKDAVSEPEAAEARRKAEALRARIADKPPSARIQVDAGTLRAILTLVEVPGRTEPPTDEVSPQEAADLLGMSRPSVMRLIERGHLRPRKVLSHNKLSRAEILSYRAEHSWQRRDALANLAALTEEHDF